MVEDSYLKLLVTTSILLGFTCNQSSFGNFKHHPLAMGDTNESSYVKQIFENLAGSWQLQRTVGDFATMEGQAYFYKIQANNCLYYYREAGDLKLKDGSYFFAYREYAYSYNNQEIFVYFWDAVQNKVAYCIN